MNTLKIKAGWRYRKEKEREGESLGEGMDWMREGHIEWGLGNERVYVYIHIYTCYFWKVHKNFISFSAREHGKGKICFSLHLYD